MLFVRKFKTRSDAYYALEVARQNYESCDREYHEYYGTFGDASDRHGKHLRQRLFSAYHQLDRVLESCRRSGFSEVATKYYLLD